MRSVDKVVWPLGGQSCVNDKLRRWRVWWFSLRSLQDDSKNREDGERQELMVVSAS